MVWGQSYDTSNVIRRVVRHQEKERQLRQKYKSDPNQFLVELGKYHDKELNKKPNVLDIHSNMLRGGIDAGKGYAKVVSGGKAIVGVGVASGLGAVAGFGLGGYLGISPALAASRSGLEDAFEHESWGLLPEVMSDSAEEIMLSATIGAAAGIPSGPIYGLGAVAAGGVAAVTLGAVGGAVVGAVVGGYNTLETAGQALANEVTLGMNNGLKYGKGIDRFISGTPFTALPFRALVAKTIGAGFGAIGGGLYGVAKGLAYLARPILGGLGEDFGFSTTTDTHYSYQKSQDLMAQRREQLRRGEKIEDNSPIISSLIYDYNLQESQRNIDYLDGQHTATKFFIT
jgi:hypothetical protein